MQNKMPFYIKDFKAARGILMKPLKGYAAFKTAEEMDRHKARLAAKRQAQREAQKMEENDADRGHDEVSSVD